MADKAEAPEAFMESFKDDKNWDVVHRGVPVFTPHTAMGANGESLYEVTEADLATIAANMQRDVDKFLKPAKGTIGHRDNKKPELEQPKLCSYFVRPRVGTFGPEKIPAVLVDEYVCKGMGETAKNFPERSPEYRHRTKEISSIARLIREPALKMGMVAAYEEGEEEPLYCYKAGFGSPEEGMAAMVPDYSPASNTRQTTLPKDEQLQADRMLHYLVTTNPLMMAIAKEYAGKSVPSRQPEEPEDTSMSSAEPSKQKHEAEMKYAADLTAVRNELAAERAEAAADRCLSKGVKATREHLVSRFSTCQDRAAVTALEGDIVTHYAKNEIAPLGNEGIQLATKAAQQTAEVEVSPEELVSYARAEGVDAGDQAAWAAMEEKVKASKRAKVAIK